MNSIYVHNEHSMCTPNLKPISNMHLYTIDTKTYITEKYNREINPAFDFDFDIHYITYYLC